jgi:hypothetical protein
LETIRLENTANANAAAATADAAGGSGQNSTRSRKNGSTINGATGGLNVVVAGAGVVTPIGEAMSQAENLKRELLRVQAGITLLSQSVERLSENVVVDTRW